MCACAQEVIYCRKLATEFGFLQVASTRVYEDNHGAICLAENGHFGGRTKHVHLAGVLSQTASISASSGWCHDHQPTRSLIAARLRALILHTRADTHMLLAQAAMHTLATQVLLRTRCDARDATRKLPCTRCDARAHTHELLRTYCCAHAAVHMLLRTRSHASMTA